MVVPTGAPMQCATQSQIDYRHPGIWSKRQVSNAERAASNKGGLAKETRKFFFALHPIVQ